jgi:hypothetical protein
MGGPPLTQPPGPEVPTLTPVTHAPFEQTLPAAQALPHVWQLLLSVFRSTHVLPHALYPAGHEPALTQLPAEQTCAPVHVRPQPPQLLGSETVEMHTPPQNDSYVGHTQAPPEHVWPPVQGGQTPPLLLLLLLLELVPHTFGLFAPQTLPLGHVAPHCTGGPPQPSAMNPQSKPRPGQSAAVRGVHAPVLLTHMLG